MQTIWVFEDICCAPTEVKCNVIQQCNGSFRVSLYFLQLLRFIEYTKYGIVATMVANRMYARRTCFLRFVLTFFQ